MLTKTFSLLDGTILTQKLKDFTLLNRRITHGLRSQVKIASVAAIAMVIAAYTNHSTSQTRITSLNSA